MLKMQHKTNKISSYNSLRLTAMLYTADPI